MFLGGSRRSRPFLRAVVGTCVAATAVAIAAPSATGAADDVSFTIATTQDVDSLNVTVGVLVIDYEIWNLTLPTLTDKAADDFAIAPAMATSWESSGDGLVWTYHLRDGMKWSDGQPMNADDVVYTINRSVEEGWANHVSTTGNIVATSPDPLTVVLTSSVSDPKLPVMDVYILPEHIYAKVSAEDLPNYAAEDNVSGGPFMITQRKEGEFVTLQRNPNWWGAPLAMDTIVFQIFSAAEAQYNALVAGDVDAVDDVPAKIFASIPDGEGKTITKLPGNNGSYSELAMNAGCATGIGDGHPALEDPLVRRAINYAIDRDQLIDKVLNGYGTPAYAIIPSANPAFDLKLPAGVEQYTYDPDEAKALLDQAGWTDSDGDGVRDKDGTKLELRYFDRSTGDASATTEFITEWLRDVGIATDVSTYDEESLTALQGKGEYDLFTWGWTPFVDPDPMMSYMTTGNVSTDPEVGGYNDANWCNADYDKLYEAQKVELDPVKRAALIQQALLVFYQDAPYAVLYKYDSLQAIRGDRWQHFVRQPAETGPVFFAQTYTGYTGLQVRSSSGDDGTSTGLIVGIVVGAVVVIAGVGFVLMRRKKTDDDRE